jgi:recombination protein RecT
MADSRQITPIDQIRGDLQRMESQFSNALPAHIPAERFTRVLMTAIQNNPKLLNCRRQSLFNAMMKAAQDGLLPDGREGVIVPFGDSDDSVPGGKASDTASWIPMVTGIRKKARNSGEISDWYCEVVHEGDDFDFQLGDDPHIRHKPSLNGGTERKIICAYSICRFKDGTVAREVMSIGEVEDIRNHYSRAKKGPWSDPVAYGEMVKKTVARRHSKQLPMSTDLDTLMRRDDELYDFRGAKQEGEKAKRGRPSNTKAALDHFANGDDTPGEQTEAGLGDALPPHDAVTGEIISASGAGGGPEQVSPKTPEAYFTYAKSMITTMNNKDAAKAFFNSDAQRKIRKDLGIPVDDTLKFVEEVFNK